MHPYLVGLIGDEVCSSLTPPMHMAEARALGLDYVYRTVDLLEHRIPATQIGRLLDQAHVFGFDALNVTHPVKRLVPPRMDELSDEATAVGAVNTVLIDAAGRMIGHNTDVTGFAAAMRDGLPDADLGAVVVIGAGGAGGAVGDALAQLGAERLEIVDLDETRAAQLAGDLRDRRGTDTASGGPGSLPARLAAASGVVHCTPTGMAHHPGLPFDPTLLSPRLWVADIVYRPLDTPLLQAARAVGCPTLDGGLMAIRQAADALRLITGLRPDVDRMRRHFRSLVESENR